MVGRTPQDITADDGTVGSSGSDQRSVQMANIAAGKAVGELVRTTLGPRGLDKLLVDDDGMGIVTNNGASILREMVDHPIGDIIADLSVSHEDGVRDGTTTTAVLAGRLLGEAETLIERDIHPTTIARGYRAAAERAGEILDEHATVIEPSDTERLTSLAATSMSGKGTMKEDVVPSLVVEAVQRVRTDGDVDRDAIRIEKITGAPVDNSVMMDGVILDQERADSVTPYRVEDATIAVFDKDIEPRESGLELDVDVTTPSDVARIQENQRAEIVSIVDHLDDLGVDAVIGGENIAEELRERLAKRGMYVVRRVHDDEIAHLAKATGANVKGTVRELSADDLGYAEIVEETDLGGELQTRVQGCATETTATLVLYGSTRDVVDELHRAVKDAISVVSCAIDEPKIIPGGGAPETAIALRLHQYAKEFDSREQLAIEAYANALEVVPSTLAENAGVDPILGLVNLRAVQSNGDTLAGIDGETGEIIDPVEAGIIEPFSVKLRSITTAPQVAETILRIDDFLPMSFEIDEDKLPANGPAGGMGAP
ncbi:thermosome subunit alpha [Halopenitus sp. H-Gu1]|uniref:thermosome subunit alpha n=1 Tax=Halopenitus sp. H-Gu1 TaxID=3242697 RepID=UPI00359E92D7